MLVGVERGEGGGRAYGAFAGDDDFAGFVELGVDVGGLPAGAKGHGAAGVGRGFVGVGVDEFDILELVCPDA